MSYCHYLIMRHIILAEMSVIIQCRSPFFIKSCDSQGFRGKSGFFEISFQKAVFTLSFG